MNTPPLYGSMRCVKCGSPNTNSSWAPAETVRDITKRPRTIPPMPFGEPPSDRDLIERDCLNCEYSWWEIPLDAPEAANQTEEPLAAENRALRHLIVSIARQVNLNVLDGSTYQVIKNVLDSDAYGEVDITEAAPYFAPLRPENT